MKKMFLVVYLCAFSLAGLMSGDGKPLQGLNETGEKGGTGLEDTIGLQKSKEKSEESDVKKFKIDFEVSVKENQLGEELRQELDKFARIADGKSIQVLIDILKDLNEPLSQSFKMKTEKAWAGIKGFGSKIKEKTREGWTKIKENRKTAAAVVGGLAALGGGAYFFREGIAQNIANVKGLPGKGWRMAKEKGSSAWEYAREIPGKVKGKFKKG